MEFNLAKEYVLDFEDTNGNRVIFKRKDYLEHAERHNDLKLLANRIVDTINDPDLVFLSPVGQNRYCFYKLLYSIKKTGKTKKEERYLKVVVNVSKRVYTVITAFRPNSIKEYKYSEPCQKP